MCAVCTITRNSQIHCGETESVNNIKSLTQASVHLSGHLTEGSMSVFWRDIDTKSKTLFRMREQLLIPTLKILIWTLLKIPASPYLNMTTESSGLQLFYHMFSLELRELETGTFWFLVNRRREKRLKKRRRRKRRRRERCGTLCMSSGIQVQGAEQAE